MGTLDLDLALGRRMLIDSKVNKLQYYIIYIKKLLLYYFFKKKTAALSLSLMSNPLCSSSCSREEGNNHLSVPVNLQKLLIPLSLYLSFAFPDQSGDC